MSILYASIKIHLGENSSGFRASRERIFTDKSLWNFTLWMMFVPISYLFIAESSFNLFRYLENSGIFLRISLVLLNGIYAIKSFEIISLMGYISEELRPLWWPSMYCLKILPLCPPATSVRNVAILIYSSVLHV